MCNVLVTVLEQNTQDRTHGLFGISESISTTRMVGPWLRALTMLTKKKFF